MGNVSGVIEEVAMEVTHSNDMVSKKLTHGCNLFIQNESAREAFVKFIKSGSWVSQLQTESGVLTDVDPVGGGKTVQDYILPNGTSAESVRQYFRDREDSESDPAVDGNSKEGEAAMKVIETCFSESAMRPVLLASVFPLFIESPEYQMWVDQNTSGKRSSKASAAEHEHNRAQRLDELFSPTQRRVQDIVTHAMHSCDEQELNQMLMSGNWLQSLLASVEDLPLCVTLATARKERWGFPLVYVNRAFETVTQYSRDEIVGMNCNFLQTGKSEPEQIEKLRKALGAAQVGRCRRPSAHGGWVAGYSTGELFHDIMIEHMHTHISLLIRFKRRMHSSY